MTVNWEEAFRQVGALQEGHFLLSSGAHSPGYWEKFQVLARPLLTQRLCRLIARRFQGQEVQVVAGPALGGVILAFEVARQLGVRAIYAEREGEERVFRRGQGLSPGERVLLVDDVLTTGGSLRRVLAAVAREGGITVGVGVLVDRSEGVELGVPLYACHRLGLPIYQPQDCPQCRQGLPLLRPGSAL